MIYPRPHATEFAIDAPSSEIRPFDAWARGLGIAFDETNGYPEMESFNGLLQAITQYIKYLEQNGLSEWSADVEYPQGAGCRVGSVWYRAKLQNTGKPPATSQNEWEVFFNAGDFLFSDPLVKTNNTVSIKDASTTQKGVSRFATATEVMNKSSTQAVITAANAATVAQSTDIGVGQTWQNVTAMRESGTTYTNNTGKPIMVNIESGSLTNRETSCYVGSLRVAYSRTWNEFAQSITSSFIVPDGANYRVVSNNNFEWKELR